jgi:hypothetical protein
MLKGFTTIGLTINNKNMKTLGKVLSMGITILVFLLLVWFTIWSSLVLDAYVWEFSDDLAVAAFQRLSDVLWHLSIAFSPIWVLFSCTMLFIKLNFWWDDFMFYRRGNKKNKNTSQPKP